MSLATRCTSCGTVFRVVQDQLKVSEGWVRCGRCNEVFNALEGLFDLGRELPPTGASAAAARRRRRIGARIDRACGAREEASARTADFEKTLRFPPAAELACRRRRRKRRRAARKPLTTTTASRAAEATTRRADLGELLADPIDARLFGPRKRAEAAPKPAASSTAATASSSPTRASIPISSATTPRRPSPTLDRRPATDAGALPLESDGHPEFVRRADRRARWQSGRRGRRSAALARARDRRPRPAVRPPLSATDRGALAVAASAARRLVQRRGVPDRSAAPDRGRGRRQHAPAARRRPDTFVLSVVVAQPQRGAARDAFGRPRLTDAAGRWWHAACSRRATSRSAGRPGAASRDPAAGAAHRRSPRGHRLHGRDLLPLNLRGRSRIHHPPGDHGRPVCGSLAFDSIATFAGRFAEQILPDQLHVLNVSFLVPTLRREFGGCAGNIAYTLTALGGEPLVDGRARQRRRRLPAADRIWGADTALVRTRGDAYTAQAIIITDQDNNQITAFHPGAMQSAHADAVPRARHHASASSRPTAATRCCSTRAQLARRSIPFIFDPGQQLPMFDGDELRAFVDAGELDRGQRLRSADAVRAHGPLARALSRSHLRGIVVTLGAQGCDLWQQGAQDPRAGRRRPARSSTRPAAATPSAARCSSASSTAGRWSAARLGNRLGASRSPAGRPEPPARSHIASLPEALSSRSADRSSSSWTFVRQACSRWQFRSPSPLRHVVMWAGCRWWYGASSPTVAHRLQKSRRGASYRNSRPRRHASRSALLKVELGATAGRCRAAGRQAARRAAREAMHSAERARERERDVLPDARMPLVRPRASPTPRSFPTRRRVQASIRCGG